MSLKTNFENYTSELLKHIPIRPTQICKRSGTTLLTAGCYNQRVEDLITDGNILYVCANLKLLKIDITNENNPSYVAEKTLAPTVTAGGSFHSDIAAYCGNVSDWNNAKDDGSLSGYYVRKICQNDDYLFFIVRRSAGTHTDTVHYYGAFGIIKKSDFSLVYYTPTKTINTSIDISGNTLAIGNQMYGLTFVDITNPEAPSIIKTFQYNYREVDGEKIYIGSSDFPTTGTIMYNGIESQWGKFYTDGTNTYFCNIGFGLGFYIYDVTDLTNITEVGHWNPKNDLPFTTGEVANGGNYFHTMSCDIQYPYIHITAARTAAAPTTQPNCGVVTLDLSDLSNIHYIDVCKVSERDLQTFIDSDPCPCKMIRVNDLLIQQYEIGLLIYKVADDEKSVYYLCSYKPNNLDRFYGMYYDENYSRFWCGATTNNTSHLTSLYGYRI